MEYFRRGGLFPIEFLSPLIREKIQKEYKNGHNAIVLDGFPRSAEQLYGYEDCRVCATVCHSRKVAPNSY